MKHCVRSLGAGFPSRGGKGAPFVSLLAVGVLVSNWELIEAIVGSQKTFSMNFRTELCSEKVVSTYPGLAKGETIR